MQISIFLLQTVPKCYSIIQYTMKNLAKMIFKPPSPKKLLFLYSPTPSISKFAMETFVKFDWHYSLKQWLTLIKTNKLTSVMSKFWLCHEAADVGWIWTLFDMGSEISFTFNTVFTFITWEAKTWKEKRFIEFGIFFWKLIHEKSYS